MLRRCALVICAATLAGCQSYNFNPVGKCIIQPGNTRLTLNAVTTADILFVIDDSGSMRTQQESLARNFGAFIDALALEQKGRAQRGLEALDFHVAITTSSVFENQPAQNAPVCSDVGGGNLQCRIQFPAVGDAYSYACTTPGAACGDLIQTYYAVSQSCAASGVVLGAPFPQGNFVATGGNPRVLHFTKDLDWASWGTAAPDTRLSTLVEQFKQNVQVGTCGSGQETHLEASRLAMKRALNLDGLVQAGIARSEFPHDDSKLVVVWVGDEDDCSSPATPGVPVLLSGAPGADSCVADQQSATPRETPVREYADFFSGLNRPFAAAFITSSICTVGPDGKKTCQPGKCTCSAPAGAPAPAADCSGKSAGTRLKEMSTLLGERGFGVVEDSVCEYSFADTLQKIAELVKPPSGLRLPTQPASPEVSVLRIVGRDGATARVCNGPSPSADWWFVSCDDPNATPVVGATSCIAIKPGSACEANPGETYSAEYLGLVPEGGCATSSTASQECSSILGGRPSDWSCDIPQGQARGTCLCNGGN
ncbi:MAG TPA: hypothetical protein VFK85_08115 [Anaeromyxobacteraceae bacterium]|nr:hypothetical protein [Anaeromyxobacteraceae bacterium]